MIGVVVVWWVKEILPFFFLIFLNFFTTINLLQFLFTEQYPSGVWRHKWSSVQLAILAGFRIVIILHTSIYNKYRQLRVENKHRRSTSLYLLPTHIPITPTLFSFYSFCFMDWVEKLFFAGFIILAAAIDGARADAMVTGTVFCDQCKDGERSLFDYPIYGEIHNYNSLHSTFLHLFFSLFLFVVGNFGDILMI